MATITVFSKFPYWLAKGAINDLSDNSNTHIKVMLLTSSASPDQETWEDKADVTNEVSGTGYTSGGAELTNKSISESTKVTTFDADDVTWSSSTITARYAVIYDDTPTYDTDKKLIAYIDFGEDKSSENGDFTLQWDADGILTWTVA